MPTSLPLRRTRRALAVLAAATTLLFPAALLTTAPGAAARPHAPTADGDEEERPTPPTRMSTVGGERLGLPGTQVDRGGGIPALPRQLTARSWIVADAESGDVLAAHNAHWPLAPASTLKMLFADLLLPKFPKDRVHRVIPSDLAGIGSGSSLVGIKERQSYTVHDLWLGVFLRSGNDAVHTLAAMNGGTQKTIREMNALADLLRAEDTNVVTPDGYDAKGQVSSAYDLTLIARHGLQKPDFREYASTVRSQFPGERERGSRERPTFEIQNTNRLLTGDVGLDPYEGAAGVKNGYTTNAGHTLTGVAQRGDRVLLVTVMHPRKGTFEVYEEAAALFDWGFRAADGAEPVGRLVPPKDAEDPEAESAEDSGAARESAGGGSGEDAAGESEQPSGGVGVALGIIGTCLVVLAVAGYLVHRRWPLPELRLRRRQPEPAGAPAPAGPDAPPGPPGTAPDGPSGGGRPEGPENAGSGPSDPPRRPD